MPDTLPDIITPRPSPGLGRALASQLDPRILLEIPHALGEQARSNKVQEARRDDEEDLQRRLVAALVDEVADERAGTQATEHRERE